MNIVNANKGLPSTDTQLGQATAAAEVPGGPCELSFEEQVERMRQLTGTIAFQEKGGSARSALRPLVELCGNPWGVRLLQVGAFPAPYDEPN